MGIGTSIFIMLIIGGLAFLALKSMSEPTPEPKAAPALTMIAPKTVAPERVPPHEVIPDFLDWEVGDVLWERFDYDRWTGEIHETVKYLGTNDMFELVLEKGTTTKSKSLQYIAEEKRNGFRVYEDSKTEVQTLTPQEYVTLKWKNQRLEEIRQRKEWALERRLKEELQRRKLEEQEAIKKSVEDSDYHLRIEFMKEAMKELKSSEAHRTI